MAKTKIKKRKYTKRNKRLSTLIKYAKEHPPVTMEMAHKYFHENFVKPASEVLQASQDQQNAAALQHEEQVAVGVRCVALESVRAIMKNSEAALRLADTLHKNSDALQSAIAVMSKQIPVSLGSVKINFEADEVVNGLKKAIADLQDEAA